MHTVQAPTDGAKIAERGPLAGLVTHDVTLAADYVRRCTDLDHDARAALIDLLAQHARQVERQTERLLRFALDAVRELRSVHGQPDDTPTPPHEGYAIVGRVVTPAERPSR